MATPVRETKRFLERLLAERVAKHAGVVAVEHDDAPDAILVFDDGRSVGLEIVSTVPNDWVRAQKMAMEQLRPEIEKALARHGIRCFVQFAIEVPEHFPFGENDPSPSRRRERNAWRTGVPGQIAELASHGVGDFDREALEARGITGLAGLRIEASPMVRALPSYRWPAAKNQTLVERLLHAKAAKLPNYRARKPHLAQFWLAIGPFGPGSIDDGFSQLMDRNYITPFDRVFLVQAESPGEVWDVTPMGSGAEPLEP